MSCMTVKAMNLINVNFSYSYNSNNTRHKPFMMNLVIRLSKQLTHELRRDVNDLKKRMNKLVDPTHEFETTFKRPFYIKSTCLSLILRS